MSAIWVPEAPTLPGLYAKRPAFQIAVPNIPHLTYGTYSKPFALTFTTEADCEAWCTTFNADHPDYPHPFAPRRYQTRQHQDDTRTTVPGS